MRYPTFIKENDTIAFIAPSFGCTIEPYATAFANARKKFEQRNIVTILGPNCYKSDGIGISSTPKNCAEEFNDYYCTESNQALIACGGGELMCEILEFIDFERIRAARPKWYMGYSDNTNLGFLLPTLADVATIYGPHAPVFGMEPWHPAVQDAFDLLCGKKITMQGYDGWEKESLKTEEAPLQAFNIMEPSTMQAVNYTKTFSGRLLGGCLDIVAAIPGTKYDRVEQFVERYREDGIIWFLEACDLGVMDIRRSLWRLEQAGWLKYVKGFLFGRPYRFDNEAFGLNRYSAVTSVLEKYGVPVIMDVDLGHLPPAMPLINGSLADITLHNNQLSVTMKLN